MAIYISANIINIAGVYTKEQGQTSIILKRQEKEEL